MSKLKLTTIGISLLLGACGQYEFKTQSEDAGERVVLSRAQAEPSLLDAYPCGHESRNVQVCHVPPGNPAAKHNICIGRNAVGAHVGHHIAENGEEDYLGQCGASRPPEGPLPPEEPPVDGQPHDD